MTIRHYKCKLVAYGLEQEYFVPIDETHIPAEDKIMLFTDTMIPLRYVTKIVLLERSSKKKVYKTIYEK